MRPGTAVASAPARRLHGDDGHRHAVLAEGAVGPDRHEQANGLCVLDPQAHPVGSRSLDGRLRRGSW